MKEQVLIQMKNKIETLGSVVQSLMMEMDHLKTLSFGTSKIVKNMSDYEEAIEKLKAQANDEASAEAKTES
jgi:coenzyme F420-reducing hydrogenase delta subunit